LSFIIIVWSIALALFLIPCLLPWRWLCLYVPVAAVGITMAWQDHSAHRGEGNGLAEALAEFILIYGTAAAIGGVLARLAVLALRGLGVRWRYAWLPAPGVLALLIASPTLLQWHRDWIRRPPSAECLAAMHRLTLAGSTLHVPTAPVFLIFPKDRSEMYSVAWPPRARALCRLTARHRALEIRLLKLDFVRSLPTTGRPWQPRLCEAVRNRSWLRDFCASPVDVKAAHYPSEIVFEASKETAKLGGFHMLWELLQQAAMTELPEATILSNRIAWRMRAADGTPFAVLCRHYGTDLTSCDAVFEPRVGLAARFHFDVPRDQVADEMVAIQARVAEIAADLLRP
jgi:hypothetical protein